jgi:predicted O-methyltransferase YrrM
MLRSNYNKRKGIVMKSIKKYLKPIIRYVFKIYAQKTIVRFSSQSEVYQKMLGETLKETLENDITQAEKVFIDKIELLRKNLESSSEKIEFTDFSDGKNCLPKGGNRGIEKDRSVITTVGEICKNESGVYFWMLILFKIIRKFKPSSCIELGTCLGLSTSFQASALHLNGNGKIVTLEGAEPLASIAKKNFQTLGLCNVDLVTGGFQSTLCEVLNKNRPFDYAFIDGHLDGKTTMSNFEKIILCCEDKAVIIIDNISGTRSMKRTWKSIESDERVKFSLNLRQMGVCVIDNDRIEKQSYRIPLLSN